MDETRQIPELDIDLCAAENLIDPYSKHQRIRAAGSLVRLTRCARLVACARHAGVHAVPNDHATFVSGAGVSPSNFNIEKSFRPTSLILEADQPLHTRTRTVRPARESAGGGSGHRALCRAKRSGGGREATQTTFRARQ